MKKYIVRILIIALALGLGVQVLFAQVARDLFACMPCCMDDMDGSTPQSPSPNTDCCVIAAPEVANQFTLSAKIDPGQTDSNLLLVPVQIDGMVLSSPQDPLDRLGSWHSPPNLYDSPEKLSIFRI